MLVLGLILVLLSVAVLVAALLGGPSDPVEFDLGVGTFGTTSMTVFLLGAATVLVFVIGLEMTRSGIRREHRRRKEKRELTRLSERYESEKKHESSDDTRRDTKPSTADGTSDDTRDRDRTHDGTGDPE